MPKRQRVSMLVREQRAKAAKKDSAQAQLDSIDADDRDKTIDRQDFDSGSLSVVAPPDVVARELVSEMTPAELASSGFIPAEFSPGTVRAIRSKIAISMNQLIPHAIEVVQGKREWSAQQTQVFKTLLSKVAPDVEAKFVHHRHEHVDLNELSVEELARIARGDSD